MKNKPLLKTSYLLVFTLLLLSYEGWAQRVLTGKVSDAETNDPVPGVNILVKGTTRGAVTDFEGNYAIEVNPSDVLVFSAIGYTSREVTVGNQTSLDLQMVPDVTALSEIVVVGYTSENRANITGAVSSVQAKDLVAIPTANVEQSLQGRVSGVTVITNGQPGTSSVVRLRGFGAFGGNEPLYIVDGVPTFNTNFLQPDDIESTTVLKDAASASIYGARAANGVIIITTKKGNKDGRMRVHYDGVQGVVLPGTVDNILNPQEQADWTWQAIRNTAWQLKTTPEFNHPQYGTGSEPVLPDYILVGDRTGVVGSIDLEAERERYNIDRTQGSIYQVMRANQAGTDWWDEVTRVAATSRHQVGLSGGTERSNYYVGMGFTNQDGIVLHQDFRRYAFRINSQHSLTKNLRIGENLQTTFLSARGLMGGSGGRGAANQENQILGAFRMPAIIPVYDEFGGYGGTAARGFNNPRNPVAERDRAADNNNYSILGFGNVYAELDLFDQVTLRSSFGGSYSNSYFYSYGPPSYENSENNSDFSYSEGAGTFYNWVFTNTANWKTTIGTRHNIDVLAGTESLADGIGRNIAGTGRNPFSTDPNYVTLSNTQATGRVVNSGYGLGSRFFSYFGSVKYNFDDKYLVSALFRRDGSSQFGANNRYGVFPAFSAAWRLTSEPFFNVNWIDDLKIRGGWGEMGNSRNVDPNNQFSLFASSLGSSWYDIAGSSTGVTEGFFRNRIGNPGAKWETSETINIGLDGTFLQGKVDFVFDVWRKDTRDLLFTLEQPAVIGGAAAEPAINIGAMRNQGIDMSLKYADNLGDFRFELTGTASFLDNEIIELAPDVEFFDNGADRIGIVIRNQVGRPLSSFFGYQVEGLFQNQAEIDAAPLQEGVIKTENATAQTPAQGVGRFRYADVNGDGVITPDDRTYLGDPIPDFNGGLNIRLNYKNFELETFLITFLGVQNFHLAKWYTDFYPSFTGAARSVRVKDSFVPTELGGNGGNTVPIFEDVSNLSTNRVANSYYVENGNYLRMANLQIAYLLPSQLLSRYGIDRLRVYLQTTNLFTISNYGGVDPGVAGSADTTLGIDQGNPPVTRGFNLGINLSF